MVVTQKEEMFLSVNPNLPNKLLSSLYTQKQTGRLCDVILHCSDTKFTVHSCVLASFSTYFNDIFLPNSQEKLSGDKRIRNCISDHWSIRHPLNLNMPSASEKAIIGCSECTGKVIDFMYLGKIQIQSEHVEHIKILSTLLNVPELLLICSKYNEKQQDKKRKKIVINHNKPKKQKNDIALPLDEGHNTEKIAKHTKDDENKQSCIPNCAVTNVKEVKDANISLEKKDFTCSICDRKFETSALLRQHLETHRGRQYRCYSCRYSNHKAFALIKHLLESDHRETVCSLCMFEAENSEKLKDHLKQHNHPKPFFCSICNLRFQTRASLNTHTPKHSTEMPFSCTVCSRAFKWKQGLQSHMTVHSSEKKHLCSECGFSTAYQSTFRAHSLIHTSSVFTCPHADCSFKSVRKQNVMSHLLTHNKEKPYQCEICGQSFSQSKNLRRHAIKHDSTAEELNQRCPLCLYQTMRVDKLKLHFRNHHPESEEKLLNVRKKRQHLSNLPLHKDVQIISNCPEKNIDSLSGGKTVPILAENVNAVNKSVDIPMNSTTDADNKTFNCVPFLTNDGTILLIDSVNTTAHVQETNSLVHCLQQVTAAPYTGSQQINPQNLGSDLADSVHENADSFTITFNNLNEVQIQQLTAIVDSFNSAQQPNTSESCVMNGSAGHATETLPDQELFGALGTRDGVPQLDDLNKVLLCDEEFPDGNDGIQDSARDVIQINEECENQVLQTLQSIDSIFDSFSLPQKL